MIYKCGTELYNKHKVGDEIYAFQFERCSGKSGRLHNKAPMLGKIDGEVTGSIVRIRWFIPYKVVRGKVTSELDTNKKINALGLTFADTYDEAAQAYNNRIETEIEFHKHKISTLEKLIIKEK